MLITKKRINEIDKYIAPFKNEDSLYVATEISSEELEKQLKVAGFPTIEFAGVKLIPKAIGPVTQFNAEGRDELLKDQPKETYYHDACIKDWHGYYHYVDMPGKRYKRNHIEGPCQEISLITIGGKNYAISDLLSNTPDGKELIKHVVNLFLEIFGACEILDRNKCPEVATAKLKRANWQILPEGEIVWDRVNRYVSDEQEPNENVGKLLKYRFKTIMQHKPDMVYYGNGGFHGYLVFVFKKKTGTHGEYDIWKRYLRVS